MRWLLLPMGLVLAGFAAWLALSPSTPSEARAPAVSASPERARAADRPARTVELGAPRGEPHSHIDEASRRELDALLEREGLEP